MEERCAVNNLDAYMTSRNDRGHLNLPSLTWRRFLASLNLSLVGSVLVVLSVGGGAGLQSLWTTVTLIVVSVASLLVGVERKEASYCSRLDSFRKEGAWKLVYFLPPVLCGVLTAGASAGGVPFLYAYLLVAAAWVSYSFARWRGRDLRPKESKEEKDITNSQIDKTPETSAEWKSYFNSDQPVKHSFLFNPDFLARAASDVEAMLRQKDKSNAMAVVGPWGSGKSSCAQDIIRRLRESLPEVRVVNFKPWSFSTERELLMDFFSQLAGRDIELQRELSDYASATLGVFSPGLQGLVDHYLDSRFGTQGLRARIDSTLKSHDCPPVLVNIEDLDRLDPEMTDFCFRLIRSIADFPNVTYLVGVDSARLRHGYLDRSFTALGGSEDILDKVFDHVCHLPPNDAGMLAKAIVALSGIWADSLTSKLDVDGAILEDQMRAYLEFLVLPTLGTLRRFKHFARLATKRLEVQGVDLDIFDLIGLSAIEVSNRELFQILARYGKVWLVEVRVSYFEEQQKEALRKTKEAFSRLIASAHITEEERFLLFELFPNAEALLDDDSTVKYRTVVDSPDRKICEPVFFEEYFNHGPGENGVREGRILTLERAGEIGNEIFEYLFHVERMGTTFFSIRRRFRKLRTEDEKLRVTKALIRAAPLVDTTKLKAWRPTDGSRKLEYDYSGLLAFLYLSGGERCRTEIKSFLAEFKMSIALAHEFSVVLQPGINPHESDAECLSSLYYLATEKLVCLLGNDALVKSLNVLQMLHTAYLFARIQNDLPEAVKIYKRWFSGPAKEGLQSRIEEYTLAFCCSPVEDVTDYRRVGHTRICSFDDNGHLEILYQADLLQNVEDWAIANSVLPMPDEHFPFRSIILEPGSARIVGLSAFLWKTQIENWRNGKPASDNEVSDDSQQEPG